jgi:hypothetical protein
VNQGRDVVFIDEAVFQWGNNLRTVWQNREDKVKVGKEYLNHDSVKLIAAISLKVGFCWSEVHVEHINTSIFFRFVKRLLNETGRNVFLIWDNVGYHRPNIIKDYLARINVPWMFIVPYVPDCNAIETWFGRVKH